MSPSSESPVERFATLPPDVALHARPAGVLVREATAFAAPIELRANGRSANAKSILEVLSLGVAGGGDVSIVASGDGASEAADRLVQVIADLAE
jgi:phosphocarrier protein HPr